MNMRNKVGRNWTNSQFMALLDTAGSTTCWTASVIIISNIYVLHFKKEVLTAVNIAKKWHLWHTFTLKRVTRETSATATGRDAMLGQRRTFVLPLLWRASLCQVSRVGRGQVQHCSQGTVCHVFPQSSFENLFEDVVSCHLKKSDERPARPVCWFVSISQ